MIPDDLLRDTSGHVSHYGYCAGCKRLVREEDMEPDGIGTHLHVIVTRNSHSLVGCGPVYPDHSIEAEAARKEARG